MATVLGLYALSPARSCLTAEGRMLRDPLSFSGESAARTVGARDSGEPSPWHRRVQQQAHRRKRRGSARLWRWQALPRFVAVPLGPARGLITVAGSVTYAAAAAPADDDARSSYSSLNCCPFPPLPTTNNLLADELLAAGFNLCVFYISCAHPNTSSVPRCSLGSRPVGQGSCICVCVSCSRPRSSWANVPVLQSQLSVCTYHVNYAARPQTSWLFGLAS